MINKKDNVQYCLDFESDENENTHVPSRPKDQSIDSIPEYESLRKIKVEDLYDSNLISPVLLNILIKNKKTYLIDFLTTSESSMLRWKGAGNIRHDALIQQKKEILSAPHPYIQYYQDRIAERHIPEIDSIFQHSFIEILLLFVRQYITFLKQCGLEEISQIISLYLGFEGVPLTFKELGNVYKKTPERIRQYCMEITNDWEKLIAGGIIKNIRASESLKEAFSELEGYKYQPFPVYWLNTYFKAEDKQSPVPYFEHFLSLWGLDLLKNSLSDNNEFLIIIDKNKKRIYSDCLTSLINLLRISPFWFRKEEIDQKLEEQEEKVNREFVDLILSFHPYIERSLDGCFRLKWEYLRAMKTEIRRILFDAKRALSRKELLDTYNRYCKACDRKLINDRQLVITSDEYFLCQQKSGYWIYDPNGNKKQDIRDFISAYILSQNGLIYWEQLITKVSEAGYLYSDDTLKAYVSIFCRHSLDDPDIWIHREYATRYPDIRLRKESHRKKNSSLAHYDQIKQRTISILKGEPSFQGRMSYISSLCKDLLPPDTNTNIIYKIWNNCDSIESFTDAEGKKWLRIRDDKEE